jgi:hypothetical protein
VKPRNFPGRQERRFMRAMQRLQTVGSHHKWVEPPTDIRIRMGKEARDQANRA